MNAAIVDVTEQKRLNEAREAGIPWKKWGPYLSERQWGTVRDGQRLLVAVDVAGNRSQYYVRIPSADLAGRKVTFADLTGSARYDRYADELASRGLYLELAPWGCHVFDVTTR